MHSVGLIRPSPCEGNGEARLSLVCAVRGGKHLGGTPWEKAGSDGIAPIAEGPAVVEAALRAALRDRLGRPDLDSGLVMLCV